MIRIELGSHGLSRIRFAISPLNTTEDLLFTLGRFPHVLDSPWRARALSGACCAARSVASQGRALGAHVVTAVCARGARGSPRVCPVGFGQPL